MLRTASAAVARRAVVLNSSRRVPQCAAPRTTMAFHTTTRRDEEAKAETTPAPATQSKGGLFGTGLSEWFALPIGITAAIPLINMDIYVLNEETQLAAVFVAFCVAFYSQGGDAIYKSLDERAQLLLKEHNEAEDKVIAALEQKKEFLEANQNLVQDFEAINEMRAKTYEDLNAAGVIKPQHDFKLQVERMLNMIAQEEANVTEKTKVALMEEATAVVTEQFQSSKELKKAALTAAIAQIKGNVKEDAVDPVRQSFVKFFQEKTAALEKAGGDEEEKAQRAALIAKMNAVAKSEGFFFELGADGKPMAATA